MAIPFNIKTLAYSACATGILLAFSGCGGGGGSPSGMPYWLQPGTQLTWVINLENVDQLFRENVEIENPADIRNELQFIVPNTVQVEISSLPYACLITSSGLNWNGTFDYQPQSENTFNFSASSGGEVSYFFYDCSINEGSVNITPKSWQWEHRGLFLIKGTSIAFFKFNTTNAQN